MKKIRIMSIIPRIVVTTSIILLFMSMGVAAVEITVDVPSTPAQANQVVTIPVTIHHSNDIVAFSADVLNNVAGATITISETEPLSSGMYAINSKDDQNVQCVSWISANGLSADAATIFYINVVVHDESLSSVPIQLSVPTLGSDSKNLLPVGSYSVGQGVLLTTAYDGTTPVVTPTVSTAVPTITTTTVPTTSSTQIAPTATTSPIETVTITSIPTEVPTESSVTPTPVQTDVVETAPTLPSSSGQKTPVQTSGLPLILVVLSVAGAAMICSRRL